MKLKKVYIEITNHCNLTCSFCSASTKKKEEMRVAMFEDIIKQVKKYTNNVYLHVKGEPLLHTKLPQLLQVCEEQKMRVNITTNGTLLKKTYETLQMFSCIKKINVSLHCEQDNPNYFADVFACADTLSKTMTIVYRLWTLQNHQLDAYSQNILELLVKRYQLEKEQAQALLDENNVKVSNGIYVDKDNEFEWPSLASPILQEDGYCYALKTHIAILVDGSVVPCCLDSEGSILLGNIKTQSLDSIMQSERVLRLKKSFQDRKPCEMLCKKCSFKQRL